MKNRFKVFSLCIMAGVIASFVSTGSVLAEPKPVRVEPVEKCYHFIADYQTDRCGPKSSTWLIVWIREKGPCTVEVYASYESDVNCDNIKEDPKNHLPAEHLDIVSIYSNNESKKTKWLSDVLVDDAKCSEVWLRFIDDKNCNYRCYGSGGSAYCK